jgi:Rrf2 family protein
MRLSKRGEYALRALIGLGLAQRQGRALLQIPELARREKLPVKFLEQILVELKTLGYLDSKRGKHGGYFLRLPLEDIRIGTVVRQLEGPLAPISCVSVTAYEKCSCPDEEHCALRMLMLGVRNAIAEILDRHTLAETVDAALDKCRHDRLPLPFAPEPPPAR